MAEIILWHLTNTIACVDAIYTYFHNFGNTVRLFLSIFSLGSDLPNDTYEHMFSRSLNRNTVTLKNIHLCNFISWEPRLAVPYRTLTYVKRRCTLVLARPNNIFRLSL